MSKFFSIFALSFATFSLILTGTLITNAGGFDAGMIVKVTASPSLNVRDAQCKIVSNLKYGQTFTIKSNTQKTCTIYGSTHYMIEVFPGQYVSSNYIQYVGQDTTGNNYLTTLATTKSALNVRDENCKIIGTVKSGVKLTTIKNVQAGICKINGNDFTMASILSNGKVYYVALNYLIY